MPSEIRNLVERIDKEAIAMYRGLYGLAETARHEFIRLRYAAIDQSHERLIELIGEEEAIPLVNRLIEEVRVLCECEQELREGK